MKTVHNVKLTDEEYNTLVHVGNLLKTNTLHIKPKIKKLKIKKPKIKTKITQYEQRRRKNNHVCVYCNKHYLTTQTLYSHTLKFHNIVLNPSYKKCYRCNYMLSPDNFIFNEVIHKQCHECRKKTSAYMRTQYELARKARLHNL